MKIKIRLGLEIVEAEVVKLNKNTVWVKLANGKVIKRHRAKHVV